MKATDESFDILGFTKEEKDSVYRITAGIMHSGNMVYTQKPREEQAENGNVELSEKAGFMLGISGAEYAKALCSPRVKVRVVKWIAKLRLRKKKTHFRK